MGQVEKWIVLAWTTFIVALMQPLEVQTSHIVFLHTISSFSHRVPQWPLVTGLVNKGHEVTFISGYEGGEEMSHPNVTDLKINELGDFMDWILQHFDINYRIWGLQPPTIPILEIVHTFACKELYRSPMFQDWKKHTKSIDLIVVDLGAECAYGLAKAFDAKMIIFQTTPILAKNLEVFGIPTESSSIPTFDDTGGCPGHPPFGFIRRFINTLAPILWRGYQIIMYELFYGNMFQKYLDLKESANLYDMERNVALYMINGGHLEEYPRSLPPFVVKLPGMHVKTIPNRNATLSDKTLEQFLSDGKSDGFIYISFGTAATAPSLPNEFLQIFFRSIESFPNLKFIWRWKGRLPDSYPKNLLLIPWVDQQELLANSRIKGFITQGGRPSMQEAFYNAVPTIIFPILADQDFNAHKYEYLRTAVVMEIGKVSQKELSNAINDILTDKSWRQRSTRLAELGKDVPMSSVDLSLWWTEFVLRHTNEELNLLKPPAMDLYWFQRRELDVWSFLLCVCAIFSLITYHIGRKLYTRYFKTKIVKNKAE